MKSKLRSQGDFKLTTHGTTVHNSLIDRLPIVAYNWIALRCVLGFMERRLLLFDFLYHRSSNAEACVLRTVMLAIVFLFLLLDESRQLCIVVVFNHREALRV